MFPHEFFQFTNRSIDDDTLVIRQKDNKDYVESHKKEIDLEFE